MQVDKLIGCKQVFKWVLSSCMHGGYGAVFAWRNRNYAKRRVVYLYQRLKVTDHGHKNWHLGPHIIVGSLVQA